MAIQTLNTIKNWFKTGSKPSQDQFWDTWDSFRHKYEKVPIKDIEELETTLDTKAEKSQLDDHKNDQIAHAGLFSGKEDKYQKGVAGGYVPLDEFVKIASQYLTIINDLTTGGEQSLLSAEQGKILQNQINGINTLLSSDNIDLDTIQEIVDAIENVQGYLNTILVNDLITGGVTKALTAEMGKVLNQNKQDKSQKGVADGYVPLNEFVKIASQYLTIINDLTTGGEQSLLSAEQGKILQNQINGINTLLSSDNVNLDTIQEIVDAIEQVQYSLSTILVNDLVTGGVTKALTAEMGKHLDQIKLTATIATDAETQITAPVAEDNKVVSRSKLYNWFDWIKKQSQTISGSWTFTNTVTAQEAKLENELTTLNQVRALATLQAILQENPFAHVDDLESYIRLLGGSEGKRLIEMLIGSDSMQNSFTITPTTANLQSSELIKNLTAIISVENGLIKLRQTDDEQLVSTDIVVEKPVSDSRYIFKAKTEGKDYFVATTEDIPAKTPDATTTVKGSVKLAGDLGGTADYPTTPTAIHKSGNESRTGDLTISNLTTPSSLILQGGSSTSPILRITNTGTYPSFISSTSGSQSAASFATSGTGAAMYLNSSGAGMLFTGSNNSSETSSLDKFGKFMAITGEFAGNITANAFIKRGGTDMQFLKANGTSDSTEYVTATTIQDVSGLKTFLAGKLGLRNIANTFTSFFTNANNASRTYTLQNRDGTLLDNTDLSTINSSLATKQSVFTGTANYITKSLNATTLIISRLFDNGTFFGIGTAKTPTKDITLGNQTNREIGIEESDNVSLGKNLAIRAGRTINYVENVMFNPLNQLKRGYTGATVAPNGNVYMSCGYTSQGIYMQTGGIGDFVDLVQTARNYWQMAVSTSGDIFVVVNGGIMYVQTGGTGNFVAVSGITARSYRGLCIDPSGNMYASAYGGDLYKRAAGSSGDFVSLSQGNRSWQQMTAAPNGDIYACVENGGIFMQAGGTGAFVDLGQTVRSWTGLAAAQNGNIYACVGTGAGGDIYMRTAGAGNFMPLSQVTRYYYGLAAAPNGNIYAAVGGGAVPEDIYMQQNNGVGSPNLNGGSLDLIAGTGKGNAQSRIRLYTGQKLASGTDMQVETLRMEINEDGILKRIGTPIYADNVAALAGGLTAGMEYRTSTGIKMEVY